MKRIGLRNVKTAIAVFICLLTNVVLVFFLGKAEAFNYYTPFFAGIAACYSLQSDTLKSLKQAKIRSIGTIIGGIFGMILLLFYEEIMLYPIKSLGGDSLALLAQYLLVSLGIIFVIHITVVLKQTDATFITCLTFLSVTVSIRNGGLPVVIFAINRILSTLYGVFIAIIVNLLNVICIPLHRRKDIIFVCGYEKCLSDKNYVNGFKKYTINRLLFLKANITFISERSPSTIDQLTNNIKLKLPVIVMNGAAIYDYEKHIYTHIVTIPKIISRKIEQLIKASNCNYFGNTIYDNVEHMFIHHLDNEAEIDFYQKIKNAHYTNFDRDQVPDDADVVYYTVINKKAIIYQLKENLKTFDVIMVTHPLEAFKEYEILNIYAKEVSNCHFLKHPMFKDKQIYAIGNGNAIEPLFPKAQYSLCNDNADGNLILNCKEFINSKSNDKLIRRMKKLFHEKKR